jgi:hypothetical protein
VGSRTAATVSMYDLSARYGVVLLEVAM